MVMGIEMKQEREWKIAQNINVRVDLISAAKQQLQLLAAVDQHRWLHEDGSALQRAIYRYNACWLPMLDKHTKSPFFEGKLVVPLDCEWVWHCHRLNPITYKSDCQELYGKILDNKNVVSSIQGASEKETAEVWKSLYPNESFVLDPNTIGNDNNEEKVNEDVKFTKYDLVAAVLRQGSFFYQVSRPCMSNDLYLEGAVARYKGFLHLTKRNIERAIRIPLVPTYDIDLIWHTHQLHPVSYCGDMVNLIGKILGHDDTDSDRTKGQKLDVGLTGTINIWSRMYGSRYCRAGAMYRGPAPASSSEKKLIISNEGKEVMPLQELKMMEVMLEFVNVKGVSEEHEGKKLFVSFTKTQPDSFFNAKRRLPVLSESEEKQVASFHCQPSGKLIFELMVESPPCKESSQASHQTLGSSSISLEELLLPRSGLMIEKWLELMPSTNSGDHTPISLRVAISVTPPTPAPLSLQMIRLAASLCAKACGACYTAGACATAGTCFTAGACATAGTCFTAGACATAGTCFTSGACATAGTCYTAGACATAGSCFTAGACGACATAGACFTAGACATAGTCFTAGACGACTTAGACATAGACFTAGACATAGTCFTAGACATAGACFTAGACATAGTCFTTGACGACTTAGACATAGTCFTAGACATAGTCFTAGACATAESKAETKGHAGACFTAGTCFTAGACATAGTCFTAGACATAESEETGAKVDAGTCYTDVACAEGDNSFVSQTNASVACA